MNETEKLQRAVEAIETLGGGDYAFNCTSTGMPFLYTANNDLTLGLQMCAAADFKTERYNIIFSAYVSEMGRSMSAKTVQQLDNEVWRMQSLLTALEMEAYAPNQDEWEAFKDWLAMREEQSEIQEQTQSMSMQ